jgi:CubicO group peptidase (beta-lactamase class C family)
MRSSARDLIKWNDALLRGDVLTSASILQMATPADLADGRLTSQGRFNTDPTDPGGEYGYAMRIHSLDGHREIGHEGDIFGFNAALYALPSSLSPHRSPLTGTGRQAPNSLRVSKDPMSRRPSVIT